MTLSLLLGLGTAAVVLLAGCEVGTGADDRDDECKPVRQSLPGTWRSACLFLEVRPNDEDENIFFRDSYSFDGDDFRRDYREFADIDCEVEAERLAVLAEGTYEIGDDFAASSEGLDVCAIDLDYDEVTEELDEDEVFEVPDTPFTVFDIVYLLPEPDDDAEPQSLYTGRLDGGRFEENTGEARPRSIDFDVEYQRE